MHEERTWVTSAEAAAILGCTQRTITGRINKGIIRAKKDDDGRYYIEKADLARDFPEEMQQEYERNREKIQGMEARKRLEEKIRHLEELLGEKSKQNSQLIDQLSVQNTKELKMLDAINSHARLLEYKETGGKTLARGLWPFRKK